VRDLFEVATRRDNALMLLCCLRVIRPSLPAFRGIRFVRFYQYFEAAQADPGLERFVALVDQTNTSPHYKRCARMDVAGALTTQGIEMADLTAEGLLHHAVETRRGRYGAGYEHHIGHLAWEVGVDLTEKACGHSATRVTPRTPPAKGWSNWGGDQVAVVRKGVKNDIASWHYIVPRASLHST
jgi:hypothetical protein